MNLDDIAAELRAHVARKYKNQREAAKAWECSPALVSAVLLGKRNPTQLMLDAIGYEPVPYTPAFQRKKKAKK